MISKVTENDFNESAGNRKLQAELEKNRRIKTYFYENDKTPNTDGYFEVLDLQGAAMKRFVVQIKTVRKMTCLKNGDYSYSADTAFLHYVLENIDQNPAIFFIVDLSKGTMYYKYLSLEYLLSLKFGHKKKIALRLSEADVMTEETFYDFCAGLIRKMMLEYSNVFTQALLPDLDELIQAESMSEKADVEKENTWLLYSDELEKRKVMLKLRALNNDPEHTTKVSYEYLLPVGHEESKMLRIPPEILEKYKDIRLLGTGGTSRVYSLTSKFTDSKVALKITPIINPYFRPLLHAFKISDHLRHFAIPRVLNYFSDDQAEYMIMDLIEGLDLYKLTSLGVLNLTEIIAIIAELCDVVDFLYLNNVIHRDIKPSNIMIGRSHSITLLDFDMATNTNEPFHDNVIMGTMRYAAPETFSPFYASVMSSEVFSIGATLYYCLRNEETRKYVKGHISGRALVDYINHYSGEEFGYGLEILKKALAFNPKKRYESVLKMKEDLMIWQKKEYLNPSELNRALARSKESYYKENFHK